MRIVTYNTRGSLGMDNRRSTPRIIETLRPLAADILCFQEIHSRLPWSGREDQPRALGEALDRRFLFQRNLNMGFGGYGVGIATRGQVVAQAEHFLPSGKEQRGALEVRLQNVGGLRALTVICTHWGLDETERMQQAEALGDIVRAAPHPLVVCGDLNESADKPAVRRLLSLTGLTDADAMQNRATFAADNPDVRIDYVLHSPDLRARYLEVVESLASDHLPVLADLDRNEVTV